MASNSSDSCIQSPSSSSCASASSSSSHSSPSAVPSKKRGGRSAGRKSLKHMAAPGTPSGIPTVSSSAPQTPASAQQLDIKTMMATTKKMLGVWDNIQFAGRVWNQPLPPQPSTGVLFLHIVIAFGILLFLFFIFAWLVRRSGQRTWLF